MKHQDMVKSKKSTKSLHPTIHPSTMLSGFTQAMDVCTLYSFHSTPLTTAWELRFSSVCRMCRQFCMYVNPFVVICTAE